MRSGVCVCVCVCDFMVFLGSWLLRYLSIWAVMYIWVSSLFYTPIICIFGLFILSRYSGCFEPDAFLWINIFFDWVYSTLFSMLEIVSSVSCVLVVRLTSKVLFEFVSFPFLVLSQFGCSLMILFLILCLEPFSFFCSTSLLDFHRFNWRIYSYPL